MKNIKGEWEGVKTSCFSTAQFQNSAEHNMLVGLQLGKKNTQKSGS